jgi:hypothetical protein
LLNFVQGNLKVFFSAEKNMSRFAAMPFGLWGGVLVFSFSHLRLGVLILIFNPTKNECVTRQNEEEKQ